MTFEVRRLCRRFGVAHEFALIDVSLRLEKGEYWVLLGPSGAGKSLLLETLMGAYAPDSGGILVDGRDVTTEAPEARRFGLVFQTAALFPHYSVAGNIEYGLVARGAAAEERRRRVEDLSSRLGLSGLMARPVGALSGGEAQRVAIARALAIEPVVLLLDEPLSLVDHNQRVDLGAEIRRVHDQLGLTTLHVTHSREEALALSTHSAIMLNGRVVQAGRTRDVFERPCSPEVARFLGVPES